MMTFDVTVDCDVGYDDIWCDARLLRLHMCMLLTCLLVIELLHSIFMQVSSASVLLSSCHWMWCSAAERQQVVWLSDMFTCILPWTRTHLGDRSFAVVSSWVWNILICIWRTNMCALCIGGRHTCLTEAVVLGDVMFYI